MRYTSLLAAILTVVASSALSLAPAGAFDLPLKTFKNDLFSDLPILDVSDDGALVVIDYQKARDLYGRDTVPEKRVRENYVSTLVTRQQAEETLSLGDHRVEFARVGPKRGADFSVIFIHGRGGDPRPRRQRLQLRRQLQPAQEPRRPERRQLLFAHHPGFRR